MKQEGSAVPELDIRDRPYRVSLDIGGTFTDIIVYDERDGTYHSGKVPSTPSDLTAGVVAAIDHSTPGAQSISFLVHGTTVGINAFLERKGERVLLLATAGASDVYHIARGTRPTLYDMQIHKPVPLVPRHDIVPIRGRLKHTGEELEPLVRDDLVAAAAYAREHGIRAIAVAFLFSYLNPEHELAAEATLHDVLPGASISLSHRVAREWREYERTSSAVLNAYIAPVLERYLGRLQTALDDRGLAVPLHIMQSSGGMLTAEAAAERPIQTLLSGPVGGTMGGAALARRLGSQNLLCIDMGGTSFDVSLVIAGKEDLAHEASVAGLPLLMPKVNIHTVGAGGGSVAHIEAGGLRVGPRSAGANPGPACYGRGGTEPTVTDANLMLGRIDADYFLGGDMHLERKASESVIARLAHELSLAPLSLAEGIVDVINAKMGQAIRTITVERGIEPRDFAIVAFGGAGPMHAAFLAEELRIKEVVIPPFPGAFSAWGMLQTAIRRDFSHPFYRRVDSVTPSDLASQLLGLSEQAYRAFESEGMNRSDIHVTYAAEMRYVGQEYTLRVPIDLAETESDELGPMLQGRLAAIHEERYGHANLDAPVEFVMVRAVAVSDLQETSLRGEGRRQPGDGGVRRDATVFFNGKALQTAVLRRSSLGSDEIVKGPAVIVEPTATTVVPPNWTAECDEFGMIRLRNENLMVAR